MLGGSGFIGSALSKQLASKGYAVTQISRSKGPNSITWQDVETKGIPDVDAVVQLAGANILDKRWTPERKQEVWDSRVKTTEALVKAMAQSKSPPKVFVCGMGSIIRVPSNSKLGSAVGIYPLSETAEFDEDSTEVADNFAGKLVSGWEKSSQLPSTLKGGTRLVSMRTGMHIINRLFGTKILRRCAGKRWRRVSENVPAIQVWAWWKTGKVSGAQFST